jgi:hypothetical protein
MAMKAEINPGLSLTETITELSLVEMITGFSLLEKCIRKRIPVT